MGRRIGWLKKMQWRNMFQLWKTVFEFQKVFFITSLKNKMNFDIPTRIHIEYWTIQSRGKRVNPSGCCLVSETKEVDTTLVELFTQLIRVYQPLDCLSFLAIFDLLTKGGEV